MNILVIENSTKLLSVGLKKEEFFFQKTFLSVDPGQKLIPAIDQLLKESNTSMKQIDALAMGTGPGSFTGLRITCSIIKGFSLINKKPVITLSSFLSLAQDYAFSNKKTAVIFNARRNMIYGGIYQKKKGKLKILKKEAIFNIGDFLKEYSDNDCLFVGESILYKEQIKKHNPEAVISNSINYPHAGALIKPIQEKYTKEKFTPLSEIEPLYLHPEHCQVKRNKS